MRTETETKRALQASTRISSTACEPQTEAERALPLLLKVPHVAYELQASVGYVYDLVNLGLLDLVKIGPKASRITSASLLRVAAQRDKPSTGIPNLQQTRKASAKEAAE